jgi:uncharacterized protein YyaL (SSP411 family)
MTQKGANALIHSASPYLLQHAHNPVHWFPWGKEALEKSKNEDKPMLVSIGYSSCHWCHVMERESFENKKIAEVMNEHFVCIKVDREERPDIDQIYMEAVQIMGLQGGWPLNVFVTPDQKPFYGGTYFPPINWYQLLKSVAKAYSENKDKLLESAEAFSQSLNRSDLEKFGLTPKNAEYTKELLEEMVGPLKANFDREYGGNNRAPKFPMPSLWHFLLRANYFVNDDEISEHLENTLRQIAFGGIYDQIGGGFARYSTDGQWLAPHFEKMLYDNAQLLSLYADGYLVYRNQDFKDVVDQTVQFISREMTSDEGAFYSALDADSEGEEGKFYVWNYDEVQNVLGEEADIICGFYQITKEGNWEGKNIPNRHLSIEEFSDRYEINKEDFAGLLEQSRQKLLEYRNKRIRPGLDDKAVLSWNALMDIGLLDAYRVFQKPHYFEMAQKNLQFIFDNLSKGKSLYRTHNKGKAQIAAYMEDYAALIKLLIKMHQITLDETYLVKAKEWCDIAIDKFYDEGEKLFYYTSHDSEQLVACKKDIFDDVIPSSNAMMVDNLIHLSALLDDNHYREMADQMMGLVQPMLNADVQYMSYWGSQYLLNIAPLAEVVFIGTDYEAKRAELEQAFIPNKVVAGGTGSGKLPLTHERKAINGKTTIYVCYNKSCKLPVHNIQEALSQIEQ